MRQRPDALILIAVYEFVMAAMLLIASCIVLPIALLITPFASNGFGQFAARFAVIGITLTVVFGFAVASGIVGVGLLMLKEWARIGAILLAIPALVVFPIWTVLALLIIVYLVGEEGRSLFRHTRRVGLVASRESRRTPDQEETLYVVPTVAPPAWKAQEPVEDPIVVGDGRADTTIAPETPGANDDVQDSDGDETFEVPLG